MKLAEIAVGESLPLRINFQFDLEMLKIGGPPGGSVEKPSHTSTPLSMTGNAFVRRQT
jgi:hypothetical protein